MVFKLIMNPLPNIMIHLKLYTLKPVSGGRGNRTSLNNLGEAASVRNACDLRMRAQRLRSVRTRGSRFQVLLATVLAACLTLLASFQLESILDSASILMRRLCIGALIPGIYLHAKRYDFIGFNVCIHSIGRAHWYIEACKEER
jgi:hypothetical protein